jgi:hypothetical protein
MHWERSVAEADHTETACLGCMLLGMTVHVGVQHVWGAVMCPSRMGMVAVRLLDDPLPAAAV